MNAHELTKTPMYANPVTPELASRRRDALIALMTAMNARIMAVKLAFEPGADKLVEYNRSEMSLDDYAAVTDMYSAEKDGVDYASADYEQLNGLAFLPVCVVTRTNVSRGVIGPVLDTVVFRIETGNYDYDEAKKKLAELDAADEAIAKATAEYLSDLGVSIVRTHVDETNGEEPEFIPVGEITIQDYATRVRLRDAWEIPAYGIFRLWRQTPYGWLVTQEWSDPTGKQYIYNFSQREKP